MNEEAIPDVSSYILDWATDLNRLSQIDLITEHDLLTFCSDRGVRIRGAGAGEIVTLQQRGWLPIQGKDSAGNDLYHPFRIYPIHIALNTCRINIAATESLEPQRLMDRLPSALERLPDIKTIGTAALGRNRIVDLAILLEPIYWPKIVGSTELNGLTSEQFESATEAYGTMVRDLVGQLDVTVWRAVHERLRTDAHLMDENYDLYLLMRTATWAQRSGLKGAAAGGLWFRHVAEVIRRGFEQVHGVEWHEEDRAYETWAVAGRTVAYGSERPLDDIPVSGRYMAWRFGLLTGSIVRWYVEGKTELHAIKHVISDPGAAGIELVDLRGNLAGEKDNIALKLADSLEQDLELRRFSMISFDYDVPANVKAIRRQIQQDRVVGFVTANTPDFEFQNFTVNELAEIAACIDETHSVSGDPVRAADWSSISSGRKFEEKYTTTSARKPANLKGEEWGNALAKYAFEQPIRPDTQQERRFCVEIRAALTARMAHYDYQKKSRGFDPKTFAQIERDSNLT